MAIVKQKVGSESTGVKEALLSGSDRCRVEDAGTSDCFLMPIIFVSFRRSL